MRTQIDRKPSFIMPGVFHAPDSSFMTVYCIHEYMFCILLEICMEDGSFEYYEHNFESTKPSFFDQLGLISYMRASLIIPKTQHDNLEQFSNRISVLELNKYKKIFSGEVEKKLITEVLWAPVAFDIGEKSFSLDILKRLLEGCSADFSYCSLEEKFKKLGLMPVKFNIAQELESYISYSDKFNYGLQQLLLGTCTESREIDFSSNLGNGSAGIACINAIAIALRTGACAHLEGLTINLSGFRSHFDEFELRKAMASGNCPQDLIITGILSDKTKPSMPIQMLTNLVVFFQCLQQHRELNHIPIDILFSIGEKMGFMDIKEILIRPQYKPQARRALEWNCVETYLSEDISSRLCNELDFIFTFNRQQWRMISAALKNAIGQEVIAIFVDILPKLNETQKSILLRQMTFNGLVSEIAGQCIKEYPYNVITGKGLINSGITQIYFECLSTQNLELGKAFLSTFWNISDVKLASYDELSTSKESRIKQITLFLFKTLAQHASLAQVEVLIEESKNLYSEGMKVLRLQRGSNITNPQYVHTTSYNTYCDYLTVLQAKLQDDKGHFIGI